jgi:hypothetical protein
MAYDKRQDPGELIPFSDNVMLRNSKKADATSVTINFPNTPRKKREVELYDLSKNFHSITGYDYKSAASLLTCVRFNESGKFDAITTNILGGSSLVSFSASSSFLPPPGAIFSTQVKSAQFSWDEGSGSVVGIDSLSPDNTVFSPANYGGIFSISFWVYVDEIKENVFSSKFNEFLLFLNADGNIQFDIHDDSGNLINIKSSEVILPKTWTHITLNSSDGFTSSLDSSTVKLYINAKKDTGINITVPSTWGSLPTPTSSTLYVGWETPSSLNNLTGMISEFAMWSTRLNETEVIAIYDSSSGLSNKMDTAAIDEFRQGVSILTNKHKYSSMIFKLSSGQQRRNGHPDHYVEQREFGQPKAHLDGMAFNDIEGKFVPYVWDEAGGIQIINNTDTQQYPVVYVENLVDPSRFDGVIEPLTIRYAVTNNAIDSPFHAHDIRGDIMGGNGNQLQGADLIINDIKLKENIKQDMQKYVEDIRDPVSVGGGAPIINDNPFYDANERTEKDGVVVSKPGFVSDTRNADITFNDVQRTIAVVIQGDDTDPAITTDDVIIEIDQSSGRQRYTDLIKSAQSGFVYYGNSEVGTDSLAFGGLTRK